ncbi:MAG: hypothetical protein PHW04_18120 [Candidatus Wallbacteria bacterium]|nr:hypothetical protein [Candidatus Wallbacteria bacterium]
MNRMFKTVLFLGIMLAVSMLQAAPAKVPAFTLAWSEWPGWSVFGVAHELKLIDGAVGKLGSLEVQYNIDIVLKEMDYDPCITAYGSSQVDAACLTNMDTLPGCLGRKSVAILPNDTSFGGDMCIVVGIDKLEDLKGKTVYGLEKSVSQYLFSRNLEMKNIPETDVKWINMDPGAAALAMQQSNPDYKAIVVWNPFCLQTLNTRKDAKVLFDSTTIPGEIIDLVVVGQDALDRDGGDRFAQAVIDAYYKVMEKLENKDTADKTLIMIGEKFSNLKLEEMKKVKTGTKYITTAKEAYDFFTSEKIKETMDKVVNFSLSHQVVDKKPVIGFGTKKVAPADFRFDPSYLAKFTGNLWPTAPTITTTEVKAVTGTGETGTTKTTAETATH